MNSAEHNQLCNQRMLAFQTCKTDNSTKTICSETYTVSFDEFKFMIENNAFVDENIAKVSWWGNGLPVNGNEMMISFEVETKNGVGYVFRKHFV